MFGRVQNEAFALDGIILEFGTWRFKALGRMKHARAQSRLRGFVNYYKSTRQPIFAVVVVDQRTHGFETDPPDFIKRQASHSRFVF